MSTIPIQKIFKSSYKVYFAHTDAAGVVHHSEYIRWLEAARIDFLDEIGCSYKTLQDQKIGFSPIHIDIRYSAPLKYGDIAIIYSKFIEIKHASLTIHSEIKNQHNQLCTKATVKLACLDESQWKLIKVPISLIDAVKQFERIN
jgi:acyl-CoA thioester hydrolase